MGCFGAHEARHLADEAEDRVRLPVGADDRARDVPKVAAAELEHELVRLAGEATLEVRQEDGRENDRSAPPKAETQWYDAAVISWDR